MSAAGEAPAAFDPAAFVADLIAAGLIVVLVRDVPRGGERAGPPSYFVRSRDGQGLGSASGYGAVMERWRPALAACPDHGARVVEHLAARPTAFDPAAFVAELEAAGCGVVLSRPGTVFEPGDEVVSWFIRPTRGYTAVMARWADAMASDPDHVGRVTALLVEQWEAGEREPSCGRTCPAASAHPHSVD